MKMFKRITSLVAAWAIVAMLLPNVTFAATIASIELMNPQAVVVTFTGGTVSAGGAPGSYTFSDALNVVNVVEQAPETQYMVIADGVITPGTTTLAVGAMDGSNATLGPQAISAPTEVLISEMSPDLDGNGLDFIEIYNAGDNEADIGGWVISHSDANDDNEVTLATVTGGVILQPGAFYLLGSASSVGNATANQTFPATMELAGGHLWIADGGLDIDSITWGNGVVEDGETAATAPSATQSLERKAFGPSTATDMAVGGMDAGMGNGWDTDNFIFDFVVQSIPNPQDFSFAIEQPNFDDYDGQSGDGPMINHMNMSFAPTDAPLTIAAQMGDPMTPINEVAAELHYMQGDGTPANNTIANYTIIAGTHAGNGYWSFEVPQVTVDASTANGLYYYLKCVTAGGTAYMSASPSADMGGVEATVAQNPFIVNIEGSSAWITNDVVGTVETEGGVGISEAVVALTGSSYITHTNGNGEFTLSNVKNDYYESLTVFKAGYYDGFVNNIYVNEGEYDAGIITLYTGSGGGLSGDNNAPFILWSHPGPGMMFPPGDASQYLLIAFSEEMDSGTIDSTNIKLTTDGTTNIEEYTDANINYGGDSRPAGVPNDNFLVYIEPPAGGLTANTTYYLSLNNNVRDVGGNSVEAQTIQFNTGSNFVGAETDWTDFGSGAMNPPYVQSVYPMDGSDKTPPNVKVVVTFSEPLGSASVTADNAKLYSVNTSTGAETLVETTPALDSTGRYLSLTPATLSAGQYRVVMTGALQGSNGIYLGDPGQSENTSSYVFYDSFFRVKSATIADSVAPTILGTWPSDGETGVSVSPGSFMIQFSEAVAPSTITTNTVKLLRGSTKISSHIDLSPDLTTVFVTPKNLLAKGSDYTLQVKAPTSSAVGVRDATSAANELGADYEATFSTSSTGDTGEPELNFMNGDEFGVAIGFTEPMNAASMTDTVNRDGSVVNPANYVLKYGPPQTVAASGTAVDLSEALFSYDAPNNTVMINNLGITYSAGQDLYLDVTPANVSGSGATDLAGNTIGNEFRQLPMQSSATTGGMLGPSMMMGGGSGPDMGNMGMMMTGVFPMNGMAGQTTMYFVDFPVTSAIEDGGSVVIQFPVGFSVVNAAMDTNSPINVDMNEWNDGTITYSTADADDGVNNSNATRTIEVLFDVEGSPPANDFIHMDIKGITNSSIPKGPETSGYNVTMQVFDANYNLVETIDTMPFFTFSGGDVNLTGDITGISADDVDGDGDTVTVFLGSPMTGPMEDEVTIDVNGNGSYSFSNIPNGDYMLFTEPAYTLDGNTYFGKPMPEFMILTDPAETYDIALVKESTGDVYPVTVNIAGLTNEDIDVFASGPTGFRVKTLNGFTSGVTPNPTLYLTDGEWWVGMGPAMPQGPMAGPPPMPDWMPPPHEQVIISGDGTIAKESSDTANDGALVFNIASADLEVIGTVRDGSGNPIANAEVFAYQPSGTSGMGSFTKTAVDGSFTLKFSLTGKYSVGVWKPGLPQTQDRTIEVKTQNAANSDGNSTADIYHKGALITVANPLNFVVKKPPYTISGKLTDGTNPVSYMPVWADKSTGDGHSDTMTDSSGNYILYVNNGTWNVNGNVPGYGMAESQTVVVNGASVTQNLSPDADATYYEITGNVSIGGSVQAYMPIRAVKYNANGNHAGQEYYGMTDSAGDYVIPVQAGLYRLDIWTPDYGEVGRTDADDVPNSPANVDAGSGDVTANISIDAGDLKTVTINFTNGTSAQEGFLMIDGMVDDGNTLKPNGYHKSKYIGDLSVISTLSLQERDYVFHLDIPGVGQFTPQASDLTESGTVRVAGAMDVTFILPNLTDANAATTIEGNVSDGESGVIDAWVWVHNPETGYHNGTATDGNGDYSLVLPVLVSGSYKFGADSPGYLSPEPTDVDLTDVGADGTADASHDVELTASEYTISGTLFADAVGGTQYTLDSGEAVANGWVHAEEINTGVFAHSPADGTGAYTLDVGPGTWKVFGMADGYRESQYSESGVVKRLVVSEATGSLNSKNILLTSDANWSKKTKAASMTPASGGVIDDTGTTGTGVKMTVPANALGSSSSAGQVSIADTRSVTKTKSTDPLMGEGKSITATDNSGQPITTLSNYVDMEMIYTKDDVDQLVTDGDLVDMGKLDGTQISYFDASVNDWDTLPTTKTAYYKEETEDTEWIAYQPDEYDTGFEEFINDALVDETFADFEDYKLVYKASTNHLTIFGVTIPSDEVAPGAPTGLAQTAGTGTTVTLDWNDNGEADLLEYEIYRSTSTGVTKSDDNQANDAQVAVSTFTDSGLTAWTSYFYTVTAVDDSGNESVIATEVQMCSTMTVTNGTVAVDCTVTCDSGYTASGNSCVASGGDTPSGGGGSPTAGSSKKEETLELNKVPSVVVTEPIEVEDGVVSEEISLAGNVDANEALVATISASTAITDSEGNFYSGPISPPAVVDEVFVAPEGKDVAGDVWEVGAEGVELSFSKPVTLRFPLADTVTEDMEDVKAYYVVDGGWLLAGDGGELMRDGAGGIVLVVEVDHFSKFVVMMPEVEEVVVPEPAEPDAEGGAVAPAVVLTTFEDTAGHWAAAFIEDLLEKGIVSGYEDGTFGPDNSITRAELTKIALNTFDIPTLSASEIAFMPFNDVSLEDWYAPFVQAAYVWNIVGGYDGGLFKPNASVTRAEALKILFEAEGVDVTVTTFDGGFPDVGEDDWFKDYVNYAAENGIVSGYENGSFGPNNKLTRGEVAKIASLMLTAGEGIEPEVASNTAGIVMNFVEELVK